MKTIFLKKAGLAVALSLLMAPACFAQSLITNGDFSSGNFQGWSFVTTPNGIVATPSITPFDTTDTGTPSLSAEFLVGSTAVNTQGGGGIYQDFTLTTPANLHFSMNAASYAQYANPDGGVVSVLLDGTLLDRFSFGAMFGTDTTEYASLSTYVDDVPAGPHDLEILLTRAFGVNGSGSTPALFIDNLNLTDPPPTVPEPSTGASVLIGGAICLFVYKSRFFNGA